MDGAGLFIFAGLPATGKSTLAARLVREFSSAYVRIDTIEQALRETGLSVKGPEGYIVGYALAAGNLRLGRSVVCDSVNPIELTRSAWRDVAKTVGTWFVEIEVICSDRTEHEKRVNSRTSDVRGLRLPSWRDVCDRQYDAWPQEHIIIDTAGQTPSGSWATLSYKISESKGWKRS